MANPKYLSASTLTGDDVHNAQDENLGDLKDLMIDLESGSIAYAVLSFGGVMGMGDKLFAVPWSALRVHSDKKQLILDIPKDRLKDAPGFDKGDWPNFADPKFTELVGNYYRR